MQRKRRLANKVAGCCSQALMFSNTLMGAMRVLSGLHNRYKDREFFAINKHANDKNCNLTD